MKGSRRRFFAVLAGIVTVAGTVTATPAAGAQGAGSSVTADRIAGADRYETSALIAGQFGSASAVVIANGENLKQGADALAANYLAGRVHAPVVLTGSSSISDPVLAAVVATLKGAATPTVYVMGGVDSVSDAVIDRIKSVLAPSATVKVQRIAGADRYTTAALAATAFGNVSNLLTFSDTGAAMKTAILVSGQVNADALTAGPLAYNWGVPILLAPSGSLPAAVRMVIGEQHITQLLVLGGPDRVSQRALDQAKAAGVTNIKRIAGADRFDTAAQLYAFAMDTARDSAGHHFGAGVSGGMTVYMANGLTGFPDALSVAPLAGRNGGILLTVPGDSVPQAVAAFLNARRGMFSSIVALGSPTTVRQSVLDAAQQAASAENSPTDGSSTSVAVGNGGTGNSAPPPADGAPTITAVSPLSGPIAGGQSVTITGTNLTGATEVRFGAGVATEIVVESATSLTATTPAGFLGAVDVRVRTARGLSAAASTARYTYSDAAPTMLSTTVTLPAGSQQVVSVGDDVESIDSLSIDPSPLPGTALTGGADGPLFVSATRSSTAGTVQLTASGVGCIVGVCGTPFDLSVDVTITGVDDVTDGAAGFTNPSPDRIADAITVASDVRYLNDEALVTIGTPDEPGTLDRAVTLANTVGAVVSGALSQIGVYQFRWSLPPADLDAILEQLGEFPDVAEAAPEFLYPAEADTDAPRSTWDGDGAAETWAFDTINAPEAWAQDDAATAATVGVVDVGPVFPHDDLSSVTTIGPPSALENAAGCADDTEAVGGYSCHATHVAGLACATANGAGITGSGRGCSIITYGAARGDGLVTTAAELEAATEMARTDAKVVNISLGMNAQCDPAKAGYNGDTYRGDDICSGYCLTSHGSFRFNQVARAGGDAFRALFAGPVGKNIVWTLSAGNNCGIGIHGPAGATSWSLPNVIGVAASNFDGTLASFSNFGYGVKVAAPGGEGTALDGGERGPISTVPKLCISELTTCSGYKGMMGTSMAAPIVAGVVAMVRGMNPTLDAAEAAQCVVNTAGWSTGDVKTRGAKSRPVGREPTIPLVDPIPIVDALAAAKCALGTLTPPTITNSALPFGTAGSAYTVRLTTADNREGRWDINRDINNSTALPDGLSLVGDTITGTPSAAGVYTLMIRFTDGANQTATAPLTLRIGSTAGQLPTTVEVMARGSLVTTPSAVTSLSCTTQRDCIAGGYYTPGSAPYGPTYPISWRVDPETTTVIPSPAYPQPRPRGDSSGYSVVCAGGITCYFEGTDENFINTAWTLQNNAWNSVVIPDYSSDPYRPPNFGTTPVHGPGDAWARAGLLTTADGATYPVVRTLRDGMWSLTNIPVPASIVLSENSIGGGVGYACAPDMCAGSGSFRIDPTTWKWRSMLWTDVSGDITAIEAPPPSGDPTENRTVGNVWCGQAVGTCVATGAFGEDLVSPALWTLTGGIWQAAVAPLPADARPGMSTISAATCYAAGECAVIGTYYPDGSDDAQGIMWRLHDGKWTADIMPLPAGAGSGAVAVWSLSCTSAGLCAVVGTMSVGGSGYPTVWTSQRGVWTATRLPLPKGFAEVGYLATAYTVSCDASGLCVVAGTARRPNTTPPENVEFLLWTLAAQP